MATVESGYPLDPTGVSPNNKATGELHVFTRNTNRVFALNYGAFFALSLVIRDKATGVALRDDQFFAACRLDFPSAKYNNEICALVVITDPSVGLQVTVDYQALGGIYSAAGEELVKIYDRALASIRPVAWPPVIVPYDIVTANDYKLWPTERIGFEHGVLALTRLKDAVRYGDIDSYCTVGKYAVQQSSSVAQHARDLFDAKLLEHINGANPHPQYIRDDVLESYLPWVKTPMNVTPVINAAGVPSNNVVLKGSKYRGLYGIAQKAAQFQLASDHLFTQPTTFNGVSDTITVAAQPNTHYYWRVRYQNAEDNWSDWSMPSDFTTGA